MNHIVLIVDLTFNPKLYPRWAPIIEIMTMRIIPIIINSDYIILKQSYDLFSFYRIPRNFACLVD